MCVMKPVGDDVDGLSGWKSVCSDIMTNAHDHREMDPCGACCTQMLSAPIVCFSRVCRTWKMCVNQRFVTTIYPNTLKGFMKATTCCLELVWTCCNLVVRSWCVDVFWFGFFSRRSFVHDSASIAIDLPCWKSQKISRDWWNWRGSARSGPAHAQAL